VAMLCAVTNDLFV